MAMEATWQTGADQEQAGGLGSLRCLRLMLKRIKDAQG